MPKANFQRFLGWFLLLGITSLSPPYYSAGPNSSWLGSVATGQEGANVSVGASSPLGLSVPSVATPQPLAARELAPGVLITVAPDQNAQDTAIGPLNLDYVAKHPELEWTDPDFEGGTPHFASKSETLLEMGRGVTLRHPVWAFEFSFKPVRTIEVDLPSKSGGFERKLVWYLVYRLRYVGGDLLPVLDEAGVPNAPREVNFKSLRFLPRFTLISTQSKIEKDSTILRSAVQAIADRERVGKPILDTFQIARREILPSLGDVDNSVWGVATWTDIDPRTDFFVVRVKGLTNAYQLKMEGENRKFSRKTLQIHFWRPGDTIAQAEDRIRLGVPAFLDNAMQNHILKQFAEFELEKRLDYQWVYR
ncbi:MAG: hypothetical protein SGI77_19905 [Pirellulaceae bacterium]|nr:hypothetical protein [Pirellulaceae bacterium]